MFFKSSKLFLFVFVLFFSFQITSAQGFNYRDFFNNFAGGFHSLNVIMNLINFGGPMSATRGVLSPNIIPEPIENRDLQTSSDPEEEEFIDIGEGNSDIADEIEKEEKKQQAKEIETKLNSIDAADAKNFDANNACNTNTVENVSACKKGLFEGCATAVMLKTTLAPECKSFPTQDYQNYIQEKTKLLNSPGSTPQPVQTSVGPVTPTSYNPASAGPATDGRSLFNNPVQPTPAQQQQIDNAIKADKQVPFSQTNMRPNDQIKDGEWIRGNATLFAINGGANEAGQKMNKTTAFGYNPYDPKTKLVSLPFKTVDRFFGTTLDACIKAKDTKCIGRIKSQVKDRAIEVVNETTGQRGIYPLGDLGPAEWAVIKNNAQIDLTRGAGNEVGVTGKNLVRFRPAPVGAK